MFRPTLPTAFKKKKKSLSNTRRQILLTSERKRQVRDRPYKEGEHQSLFSLRRSPPQLKTHHPLKPRQGFCKVRFRPSPVHCINDMAEFVPSKIKLFAGNKTLTDSHCGSKRGRCHSTTTNAKYCESPTSGVQSARTATSTIRS